MTVPGDLSVQLYTVRSLLAADLDGTLATVADLGFGLVEPFDLLVYADGLRTSLPRHGLAAPTALRVVELDDTDGDLLEAVRASRQFVLATDG